MFLTGQREVEQLCKRLRQALQPKAARPPRSHHKANHKASGAASAALPEQQGQSISSLLPEDFESKAEAADEHVAGQDDLDDLYGGDALEAAGEAAAAAGGDSCDDDVEVGASCLPGHDVKTQLLDEGFQPITSAQSHLQIQHPFDFGRIDMTVQLQMDIITKTLRGIW